MRLRALRFLRTLSAPGFIDLLKVYILNPKKHLSATLSSFVERTRGDTSVRRKRRLSCLNV